MSQVRRLAGACISQPQERDDIDHRRDTRRYRRGGHPRRRACGRRPRSGRRTARRAGVATSPSPGRQATIRHPAPRPLTSQHAIRSRSGRSSTHITECTGQVTRTMADHGGGGNSLDQESGRPSSWSNLNAQSSYCKPAASSTARQSPCAIASTRRSS